MSHEYEFRGNVSYKKTLNETTKKMKKENPYGVQYCSKLNMNIDSLKRLRTSIHISRVPIVEIQLIDSGGITRSV